MKSTNTFGVHFTLRKNRPVDGKFPIYARISVNGSRCELALKCHIQEKDWNEIKGAAKPKTNELKELNTYLEKVRSKLGEHYRELELNDEVLTPELLKNSFLGIVPFGQNMTLCKAIDQHNNFMQKVLKPGTLKNYYTTAGYLKNYCKISYSGADIQLKQLAPEFITHFENYIRNNPIKKGDPCNQNGLMKHMERLKKVVTWSCSMGWLIKSPFNLYKLKFNRKERDFLTAEELDKLESFQFNNDRLKLVRDLFVFSCYTGLAYCDAIALTPDQIGRDILSRYWIYTNRTKTEIRVDIPLLTTAAGIYEEYRTNPVSIQQGKIFPWVSNQEVNRILKIIAEVVGITKHLTFHLARHTFATTVTLMNEVPIETISKMLGHTKISTTLIYAHVLNAKVGIDMEKLQTKLNARKKKEEEPLPIAV